MGRLDQHPPVVGTGLGNRDLDVAGCYIAVQLEVGEACARHRGPASIAKPPQWRSTVGRRDQDLDGLDPAVGIDHLGLDAEVGLFGLAIAHLQVDRPDPAGQKLAQLVGRDRQADCVDIVQLGDGYAD